MVYDLGGYTFDVTLLKMTAGEHHQRITVLATGGSDHLGGKDWDHILYNYLEEAFCTDIGLLPEELEPETRQHIRAKVEGTYFIERKVNYSELIDIYAPIRLKQISI